MTSVSMYEMIKAREAFLVDFQCSLQKALNLAFGNPRDFEEHNPEKTKRLFKKQRRKLAKRLGWSVRRVNKLFADDANPKIKTLAEVFRVLGFTANFEIERK